MKGATFSLLFLSTLIVVYLLLGGFMFYITESGTETESMNQYYKLFSDLKQNYNISDRIMSKILLTHRKACSLGISDPQMRKWDFIGSVYFAGTVQTTIGYGHASPTTLTGKIILILFALTSIPLNMLFLNMALETNVRSLKKTLIFSYRILEKKKIIKKKPDWSILPIGQAFLVMSFIFLITVGASCMLFAYVEGWAVLESVYFVVVSFTTVGFGDFVPSKESSSHNTSDVYRILNLVVIILGSIVTYILMNLLATVYKNGVNVLATSCFTSCIVEKETHSEHKSVSGKFGISRSTTSSLSTGGAEEMGSFAAIQRAIDRIRTKAETSETGGSELTAVNTIEAVLQNEYEKVNARQKSIPLARWQRAAAKARLSARRRYSNVYNSVLIDGNVTNTGDIYAISNRSIRNSQKLNRNEIQETCLKNQVTVNDYHYENCNNLGNPPIISITHDVPHVTHEDILKDQLEKRMKRRSTKSTYLPDKDDLSESSSRQCNFSDNQQDESGEIKMFTIPVADESKNLGKSESQSADDYQILNVPKINNTSNIYDDEIQGISLQVVRHKGIDPNHTSCSYEDEGVFRDSTPNSVRNNNYSCNLNNNNCVCNNKMNNDCNTNFDGNICNHYTKTNEQNMQCENSNSDNENSWEDNNSYNYNNNRKQCPCYKDINGKNNEVNFNNSYQSNRDFYSHFNNNHFNNSRNSQDINDRDNNEDNENIKINNTYYHNNHKNRNLYWSGNSRNIGDDNNSENDENNTHYNNNVCWDNLHGNENHRYNRNGDDENKNTYYNKSTDSWDPYYSSCSDNHNHKISNNHIVMDATEEETDNELTDTKSQDSSTQSLDFSSNIFSQTPKEDENEVKDKIVYTTNSQSNCQTDIRFLDKRYNPHVLSQYRNQFDNRERVHAKRKEWRSTSLNNKEYDPKRVHKLTNIYKEQRKLSLGNNKNVSRSKTFEGYFTGNNWRDIDTDFGSGITPKVADGIKRKYLRSISLNEYEQNCGVDKISSNISRNLEHISCKNRVHKGVKWSGKRDARNAKKCKSVPLSNEDYSVETRNFACVHRPEERTKFIFQ